MGQVLKGSELTGKLKPGAQLKCVVSHHGRYKEGTTYTFVRDDDKYSGIICRYQGIEISDAARDTKFEVLEKCGLKSRLLLLC